MGKPIETKVKFHWKRGDNGRKSNMHFAATYIIEKLEEHC
jgi:hypothetical protein